MQHLKELNTRQREAAEHKDGPLMIVAGAGSGKTKTITHRIAHLIANGIAPESILAVTFTNKAAGEMRERITRLLSDAPSANLPISSFAQNTSPTVCTFHSLGVRILREHGRALNIPRSFSIWDRADSIRATKRALKALELDKTYEPRTILSKISRIKSEGIPRNVFEEQIQNPWEETVAEVWKQYARYLKESNALDFEDLLLETLRLLNAHEQVRAYYQAHWTHITIDEYQDTNHVQFELARILAAPENNICVVGDIDQNIYSWRGANIEYLLSFEETFPRAKLVTLEQNYRSTQTVLSAANEIIVRNIRRHEKNLFTKNEEGEPISLYSAASEKDEAQFVAAECQSLINDGISAEEIVVLYRANFQSRALEEAFLNADVPYRVLGTRFFERKEVKDVLSYVRAALNQQSRGDIARIASVPPRGIGKATLIRMLEGREHELTPAAQKKVGAFRELLAYIAEWAQTKPVSETLKMTIEHSGLLKHFKEQGEEGIERLENTRELVALASSYNKLAPSEGAHKLLEDAALLGEQDQLDKNEAAVSLMTAHAAKGLEFDVVFITGLEEGLFPHERFDENADNEEERRLFYVALTRARKKVYLTHAMTRQMYGTRDLTEPSQFLSDIDPAYLENINSNPNAREKKVDLIDF